MHATCLNDWRLVLIFELVYCIVAPSKIWCAPRKIGTLLLATCAHSSKWPALATSSARPPRRVICLFCKRIKPGMWCGSVAHASIADIARLLNRRGKRFFALADDSLFVFESQQSKAPAAKVTINKQTLLVCHYLILDGVVVQELATQPINARV
jgi:hypothetical protein